MCLDRVPSDFKSYEWLDLLHICDKYNYIATFAVGICIDILNVTLYAGAFAFYRRFLYNNITLNETDLEALI